MSSTFWTRRCQSAPSISGQPVGSVMGMTVSRNTDTALWFPASGQAPDASAMLHLSGQMAPYRWAINGAPYGQNEPILIEEGDRVRLDLMNMTMMTHPMHIHCHTFALPNGPRKDTVLVTPMSSVSVDLQADNPGSWMTHCHNVYHGEAGMMIALNYRNSTA